MLGGSNHDLHWCEYPGQYGLDGFAAVDLVAETCRRRQGTQGRNGRAAAANQDLKA
jgi:hypothetical protein